MSAADALHPQQFARFTPEHAAKGSFDGTRVNTYRGRAAATRAVTDSRPMTPPMASPGVLTDLFHTLSGNAPRKQKPELN